MKRSQGAADAVGVATGQTIPHYRIGEQSGAGGMGVVWKARDVHLDRDVSIKVPAATALTDPERKRRSVQAASAHNHPNIITIHQIDHADGIDLIAMDTNTPLTGGTRSARSS